MRSVHCALLAPSKNFTWSAINQADYKDERHLDEMHQPADPESPPYLPVCVEHYPPILPILPLETRTKHEAFSRKAIEAATIRPFARPVRPRRLAMRIAGSM